MIFPPDALPQVTAELIAAMNPQASVTIPENAIIVHDFKIGYSMKVCSFS